MQQSITDRSLAHLKPQTKRYEVRDKLLPGFGVRISPKNQKSFFVVTRIGTRQRRVSIGHYPLVTLSSARQKALEVLRDAQRGVAPQTQKTQKGQRVEDVVDLFITKYAKPRTRAWEETKRVLDRELISRFEGRDIRSLERREVITIFDAAVARGAYYQANRILARVRKFFNWCIERGIIDTNPINGFKAPCTETARDRVLEDHELTAIWKATDAYGFPFGPFYKLLMLTAQRRGEVTGMRWSELDFDAKTWTIPANRAKNGRLQAVPLSDLAISIIETIPRRERCDFVFTTNGRTAISGYSKPKKQLDADTGISEWRIHDLRRTAASGMARMGTPPYVVEKVLNHISGTISGVAAVYNRYGYDAEKREALDKWAAYVGALISDGP